MLVLGNREVQMEDLFNSILYGDYVVTELNALAELSGDVILALWVLMTLLLLLPVIILLLQEDSR